MIQKFTQNNILNYLKNYFYAILTLQGYATINDNVQPVAIPTNDPIEGVLCDVYGWGYVTPDGKERINKKYT